MGRVIALHARVAGADFETRALRFGRDWRAHFSPSDLLEFSEYGRSEQDCPRGSWFLMSVGVGILMWMTLIAVLF
jgi:hypothetical protein